MPIHNRTRWMLTALVLFAVTISSMGFVAVNAAPLAQNFSATLLPVAGLVQYQKAGTSEWVTITDTQLVQKGDQVRTGSNGLAKLNVVTGIEVDIFPTTTVELNDLALGDTAGQVFSLYQLVGTTHTNVSRTVGASDNIEVIIPGAEVRVTGTRFIVFVSSELDSSVFSEENTVEVTARDNRPIIVTPEQFIYLDFGATDLPDVCSAALLDAVEKITILELKDQQLEATKAFLRQILRGSVNPEYRGFLRQLFELPEVDQLVLLSDQQKDEQELQELLDAIDAWSPAEDGLADFIALQIGFYTDLLELLKDPIAPETCGNNVRDRGETAATCPNDFMPEQPCGNGLCETYRNTWESCVNCENDCFTYGALARSCAQQIFADVSANRRRTPTPTIPPSGVGQ